MNIYQNKVRAIGRGVKCLGGIALMLFAWLAVMPTTASAAFMQCPSIGHAASCNVLITIDSTGAVSTA